MAVTSIWAVKSVADHAISYICNPEKTAKNRNEIDSVIKYAANESKTEQSYYVTCLNCNQEHAVQQFAETKALWRKSDGRVAFHGYQSFKAGEVDAEQAHAIGVTLAKELWGERFEVVIATHCNTDCFHNHFVINSVSFKDGKKFYNSRTDYLKMKRTSDRICRELSLSVIGYNETPYKKQINSGKTTLYDTIRVDIDRAISSSTTERHFIKMLNEMGYTLKFHKVNGELLKYPAIKPPDASHFVRFYRLGEGYSPKEIGNRILENTKREKPFVIPIIQGRIYYKKRKNKLKIKGLRALYFHYCYKLHIIKKNPKSMKKVSVLLREDMLKLERLDKQTQLLCKEKISTLEDLTAFKSEIVQQITVLTQKRHDLRNIKRKKWRNNEVYESESKQITSITKELQILRKKVFLCDEIEERSNNIAYKLKLLLDEQKNERREIENRELFGRCSRTSGQNEPTRS